MTANDPITIQQVNNGFVVKPLSYVTEMTAATDIYVFQTMAELAIFLNSHFDHRDNQISIDADAREKK